MRQTATYTVTSKVWVYPGFAAWRFVNVDKKQSAQIKEKFGARAAGFGSIRVEVSLGKSKWKTSIFPDKRSACYMLPLKAAVRSKEGIADDDTIDFTLRII